LRRCWPPASTDPHPSTFIVREMPIGLAGLMIASIVAVAMSNASSSLNSLAASSVLDFSLLRGRNADPQNLLRLSRRMTGLGIGVDELRSGEMGAATQTGLTVASLPYGSLLGLLLGTFDRGAFSRAALAGCSQD
jgi:Na+/proline symporter